MTLLDVSLRLSPGLPIYPGNPAFELLPIKRRARGDSSNVSALHLGTHSGTHVDAPRHFFDDAPGVGSLPLDVLVGPCRLVHVAGRAAVTAADLDRFDLTGVSRLLIRTDNSDAWATAVQFNPGFVYLAEDGAKRIVELGIRLVGVDYLSVEQYKAPGAPTHHALLARRIVVVEGLNLAQAAPGDYQLMCLPLHLGDADGAPARVVLGQGDPEV